MGTTRGRIALAFGALAGLAAVIAAGFTSGAAPTVAGAASHREAPLISLDPAADISDFFFFRSYEEGKANRVVLIMNVNPGEEPSSGPNYYGFDPGVTYSFGIDNDRDGVADDVRFDVNVKTEITGLVADLDLPLAYVGGGPLPPVVDVDSPGNGVRQTYELRMSVNGAPAVKLHNGRLPVLPNNVGPRTTPDYEENFLAEGIKTVDGGVRVFAGPRDDPFYIDLGAAFDTLNFRNIFGTAPGHGIDMLAGHNVHTIAIEVPTAMVSNGATVLGAYGYTSRGKIKVNGAKAGTESLVQVQRLANPLVNELIIATERKDEWNAKSPEQEADFLGYYLKPRVALAAQLVFGLNTGCLVPLPDCTPNPPAASGLDLAAFNRSDLAAVLLAYNGLVYGEGAAGTTSDLLRLNLAVPPTPLAEQSSVPGVLGGDAAAWPNGRRPADDVTDIAVKAVGGPNYLGLSSVDGVDGNDRDYPAAFPFLAEPHDGVTRVHQNP